MIHVEHCHLLLFAQSHPLTHSHSFTLAQLQDEEECTEDEEQAGLQEERKEPQAKRRCVR